MFGSSLDYLILRGIAHRQNMVDEAHLYADFRQVSQQTRATELTKLRKLVDRFEGHLRSHWLGIRLSRRQYLFQRLPLLDFISDQLMRLPRLGDYFAHNVYAVLRRRHDAAPQKVG